MPARTAATRARILLFAATVRPAEAPREALRSHRTGHLRGPGPPDPSELDHSQDGRGDHHQGKPNRPSTQPEQDVAEPPEVEADPAYVTLHRDGPSLHGVVLVAFR